MRIDIDFDKCAANGVCEAHAPNVFHIDDDGFTQFVADPPESERENVQDAIDGCPMQAIRMLES